MNDWTVKINMKHVFYARKLLDHPLFYKPDLNYAVRIEKNYVINEVYLVGYTVKDVKTDKGVEDKGTVFFGIDTGLIRLGETYYPPIKFSVPKSNIISYETEEQFIEQNITITEWAYENCYMFPINKIYEDWGRRMESMIKHYELDAWEYAPMYKYSPYRPIIEEMKKDEVSNMVKKYVKKTKDHNKPLVKQKHSEEPFREEAEYIFYTDGSGNIHDGKKRKDFGHFSVYLKNTEERWKHSEENITRNQADLLGVMSAISIAEQKGFKKVIIYTDSKNIVNWCTRDVDKDSGWFFDVKNPNIIRHVKRLREMLNMIPNINILHINRERNWAHAI